MRAARALRAFLRLETQRLRTGRGWYEARKQFLREAILTYLANPHLYSAYSKCVSPMLKNNDRTELARLKRPPCKQSGLLSRSNQWVLYKE